MNDGPLAAAEHYRIPLAAVHGAMAFFHDNEAAIHETRKLGEQLGARSAQAALEELRARNYAYKRLNIDLSLDTIRHWPDRPRPTRPSLTIRLELLHCL